MNKQRASGRKDGYACISGLATFASAHTMSNVLLRNPSEQRKAARAAAAGRGENVWGR